MDEFSVEAKLWPRGSAFAERLWSDPQETTWREAEQRLHEQRKRMVHERGIHADAFQPEFCRIHDGRCYAVRKYQTLTINDVASNNQHTETVVVKTSTESPRFLDAVIRVEELIKWSVILCFFAILVVRRRYISNTFISLIRSVKFIRIF